MKALALALLAVSLALPASARDAKVCGTGQIRGQWIDDVDSRVRGCGIENPVRVSEVQGIALVPPATMTCDTARSLRQWVRRTAKPGFSRVGGGLDELRVWDSYNCRARNNMAGGRVSAHGRGIAIDIGAFRMRDGSLVLVEKAWSDRQLGKILRDLHRGACGPFSTVLGPNYNAAHRNHLHFDKERHGGNFCH